MACIRLIDGVWKVDYRDTHKRRIFISCGQGHDGKALAEKELAGVLKSGKKAVDTRQTFGEYARWWLINCTEDLKPSTLEEYTAVLKNHLLPEFEFRPIAKIRRKEIIEFVTTLRQSGRKRKEQQGAPKRTAAKALSRSTIRNILAPMRSMYTSLIDDEDSGIDSNPAANVGKFTKKKELDAEIDESNVLTVREILTFLDKAREVSPIYQPVFQTAIYSGLRMGELIALRPMDIDFNSGVIRVRRNFYRGRIGSPKNRQARKVALKPDLGKTLAALIAFKKAAALREEMAKSATERRGMEEVVGDVMEGWLFQTPAGTRLDPSNLRKQHYRLLTSAKLRRIRFHDLRHTFASQEIALGTDLPKVSRWLGHSSIQITGDIYTHFLRDEVEPDRIGGAVAVEAAKQKRQNL